MTKPSLLPRGRSPFRLIRRAPGATRLGTCKTLGGGASGGAAGGLSEGAGAGGLSEGAGAGGLSEGAGAGGLSEGAGAGGLSEGAGVALAWRGSAAGLGAESRRIGLTRAMICRLFVRFARSRVSGRARGLVASGGSDVGASAVAGVSPSSRGGARGGSLGVAASAAGGVAGAAGLRGGDGAGARLDVEEAAVDDRGGRAGAGAEAHQAQEGFEAAAGEVAEFTRRGVVGGVEEAAVAIDVEHEHAAVLGVHRLEQAGDAERAADGAGELGFGEQLEADLAEHGPLEQAGVGDRDDEGGRELEGAAGRREGAQAFALDAEQGDARRDVERGLDDRLGDAVALAGMCEGGEGGGHALGEALCAAGIVEDRGAQGCAGIDLARGGAPWLVRRGRGGDAGWAV
jgi:hypothetical protein